MSYRSARVWSTSKEGRVGYVIMTSRTDNAALGQAVATDGRLHTLRKTLGLSRAALAELVHVSSLAVRNWETDNRVTLWPDIAERVGRFYTAATLELEVLHNELGVDIAGYVPLYIMSTKLAMPQETLMEWYREGIFDALDLGILGLWVHRDAATEIKERRAAR